MNIIKYNSSKDSTNARTGDNTTVINGGTPSGGNSESASKLAETHSIFGQPFDGTQDVSGDITNVQNITAVGGDVVVKTQTDSEGEYGGNIEADKNIKAGGDIQANGNVTATKFIGNVEASDVTTDTLQANEGTVTSISGTRLNYDNANIRQAIIDTLQSTDITTENLTVTKQAHFFELIIDKIKAAGGAVILSPADGFKVDKVSTTSSGYRVYWKATDGEKSISNMWKVNDQAICQTFNAATGTSYNVSNKYYWSLVTAVGTESIDGNDYHYLDLSGTTVDGTLNPEVGDEIAMLGYRGTDDSNRQSAIYIAAYNSIDSELKAPLFAHYRGINDFNLKAHKYTWFAANGNTIKGNLLIESGQTVEDYVAQHQAEGATQYLHTAYANSSDGSKDFTKENITGDYLYIGLKSDFTESDSELTYRDYTWSRLKGGNAYLHIAYANSADGKTNFSTSYFSGAAYIGTYSDNTENDSTDYTKYTWAKLKGDTGKGISSIINYYLATPASSGVTTSTSGWTTTVQSITTTNKYLWNYEVITYTDNSTTTTTPHIIGVYGNSGTDAEYYKLLPVIEKAEVNSSGTLAVNFRYQIVYVKGNTSSTITASSSGYKIKVLPNNSSTYYTLSYSSSPSYSNTSFQTNYHTASSKPTYFTVYLYNASGVIKDRRIVTVVFNAAATLTITDSIQSTVSGHTSSINNLNSNVSTLTNSVSSVTQKADRIQSTVNSHTASINTINGNISDLEDSVSNIEQTADSIQSTVSSLKVSSGTNLFGFNKGIVWDRMGEAIPFIQGYGVECRYTSYQKVVRLSNLGFNGIGGDFVATFYIKAVTNNTKVHIDICDVSPTAGVYITATTSWKKMTLYFKDVNSYIDVSSGYNGFMDFENLDNTDTIYIRQLQIERGTVPSEFGICLEDLQNYGNDSINNWNFNNLNTIENGFNTNGINYNVYQNNLNPSINDYLDYITLSSITLKDKTTYTLSFWAKTDTDGTEISSYLYPNILNSNLYPYYFSSNSCQTESNMSDGFTITKLTTSWRKYYIHWYVDTSNINTTLVKNIIPLRLSNTTAKISIADINFEEGYICEGNDKVSSIIRQTANDILLQVQDINIKIDNKQIELNGDTKVNGSLTLTDADQGFILNGGSGKTVISPQSIGSFYGFQNVANSVSKLYASTSEFGSDTLTNTVIFNFTKTFSIGTVPSGKTVTLSNGSVAFMKTNSGTVISPSSLSVKYKVYQGSTLKNTYSSSSTSMATMGTTTISSTDEVKITIEVKMTCLNSYWTTDSNKPVERPTANCNMNIQASVPNDAFTLIGYDGIGLNFGGNGIIYFGQNMCQLQYGNNAIRVDDNGIYKYCGSTSYSKKSHIINGTTYTDTATSSYQQEYAPLNGYKIRRVTSSGNVYADLLDEYILCRHSSGTVNIMLGIPSYFTGKCIKIKSVGQDVNVYAGTSPSNTTYKIVRSDGSQVNSREGDDNVCRSYWSDGTYWYEEFMGW